MSASSLPVASATELEAALAGGAPVVDLRPPVLPEAIDGALVLVSGAISAPWDRAGCTMPLVALPADKTAVLVLHCRSGVRVGAAAVYLRAQGFTNLVNAGGPAGPPETWAVLTKLGRVSCHPLGSLALLQLFDGEAPEGGGSSTLTYVLADVASKEAIIIDPVLNQVDRDLRAVDELGCKLVLALNTHCHADHVTGTGAMKRRVPGLVTAISEASTACADRKLVPGQLVKWGGGHSLTVLATPGHTAGCVCFHSEAIGCVFTGDALLIGGCGRTDFQGGSSETLYDSVHTQLFALPPSTAVLPAHDYKGRRFSSTGAEKAGNPRLSKGKAEFVQIMAGLGLPYPKKIDAALPANLRCGIGDDE